MKKEKCMIHNGWYFAEDYFDKVIKRMADEMIPAEGYPYIYNGYKMYFVKTGKVWRLYDAATGARVSYCQYFTMKEFKEDIENNFLGAWDDIFKYLELFKEKRFDILREKVKNYS